MNLSSGSIFVSDRDVYMCGRIDNRAVYWKNGALVYLAGDEYADASAGGIAVIDGTVYVAGAEGGRVQLWVNGKGNGSPREYSEEGTASRANAVFVAQ